MNRPAGTATAPESLEKSPPKSESDKALQTRLQLMRAAYTVAVREGIKAMTLDAVAKEAKISKGGLLYHFPTKRDLISALIEHANLAFCHQIERFRAEEPPGPGSYCRAYIKANFSLVDSKPDSSLLCGLMEAAWHDPQLLQPFQEMLAGFNAAVREDGIDPVTAQVIQFAADSVWLYGIWNIPVPTPEQAELLRDRLLQMTQEATSAHPLPSESV
jgi:AcrR family transcriptional regulator